MFKRRLLTCFLLVVALGVALGLAGSACAEEQEREQALSEPVSGSVDYIVYDRSNPQFPMMKKKTCTSYRTIKNGLPKNCDIGWEGQETWIYVGSNTTIPGERAEGDHAIFHGKVNLILEAGATLDMGYSYELSRGSTLSVYNTVMGSTAGKLKGRLLRPGTYTLKRKGANYTLRVWTHDASYDYQTVNLHGGTMELGIGTSTVTISEFPGLQLADHAVVNIYGGQMIVWGSRMDTALKGGTVYVYGGRLRAESWSNKDGIDSTLHIYGGRVEALSGGSYLGGKAMQGTAFIHGGSLRADNAQPSEGSPFGYNFNLHTGPGVIKKSGNEYGICEHKNGTCTEYGAKHSVDCDQCGMHGQQDHNYNWNVVENIPGEGSHGVKCNLCGHTGGYAEHVYGENGKCRSCGSTEVVTWANLTNRIATAANNSTITLERDIVANGESRAIRIPAGKTITIDLNGHKIDRNMGDKAIAGADGATIDFAGTGSSLTVRDSGSGTGEIRGAAGIAAIYSSGTGNTFTLESGKLTGNRTRYGAVFMKGSSFRMKGGSITANQGQYVGGVSVNEGGTFNLSGGDITDNTAGPGSEALCGGVSAESNGMQVSGSVRIRRNTVQKAEGESRDCNVLLANGKTMTATDTLQPDASIGVSAGASAGNKPVFLKGLALKGETERLEMRGSLDSFISDDPGYVPGLNSEGNAFLSNRTSTLTLDPGIGTGQPKQMTVAQGAVCVLPICGFEPPEGKLFATWTIEGEEFIELSQVTINKDTTAAAKWIDQQESEYSVTVTSEDENLGTASASASSGQRGMKIDILAIPASGYRLKEWKVMDGDVTIEDPNALHTSFEMRQANVEIRAVFEKGGVDRVTVTPDKLSLKPGETAKLEAAVYPLDVEKKTVSWTSSDPKVATVDSSGSVSAVGIGRAEITATSDDGSHTASCAVTVVHQHDMVQVPEKAATCKEEGYREHYYCKTCGKYYSDADGLNEVPYSDLMIPKTGHQWEARHETKIPATCTEKGIIESMVICAVCGEVQKREEKEIQPLGHEWDASEYYLSEDKSRILAERDCLWCFETETETAALKSEVKKEATCTETGLTVYTAEFENEAFEEQIIEVPTPMKPHTPGDAVKENVVAAACETEGSYDEVIHCAVCNKEMTRTHMTEAALGHDWSEWKTETDPQTGKEVEKRTCQRAGCGKSQTVDPEHKHKIVNVPQKDPGCETTGVKQHYECELCGKMFTDKDGKAEVDINSLVIPAAGHKEAAPIKENVKEPTCTEDGEHNEITRCERCKTVLDMKHVVDPALGHDYSKPTYEWKNDDHEVTASCTCPRCKNTETETVYTARRIIKEPTATEEGECEILANFMNSIFKDQKKKKKIPKLDPDPTDRSQQMGEDGTPYGKGAAIEAAEADMAEMTTDKDPAGTRFAPLKPKSTSQKKTSIKLTWSKSKGASGYMIYGSRSGGKYKLQRLAAAGSAAKSYNVTKAAGAKLKKGTYYKFMVIAVDQNNDIISSSKIIHVATAGNKKASNNKAVVVKAKVTKTGKSLKKYKKTGAIAVKKGKAAALKSTATKAKKTKVKKLAGIRYESSNPKVATVTAKGKVKGVGKGSATVYVFAQNGVAKTIKVKVR